MTTARMEYQPSIADAAIFIAVTGCTIVALSLAALGVEVRFALGPGTARVLTMAGEVLGYVIGLIALTARGSRWSHGLAAARLQRTDAILCIFALLAAPVVVSLLQWPTEPRVLPEPTWRIGSGIDQSVALVSTVGAQLLAIIAVPIVEELGFRRIIFGALANRFGVLVGISVSSLLFSLMHAGSHRVVGALVFGLVAGAIYSRTGSIWTCIVGHAIANLVAIQFSSGVLAWTAAIPYSGRVIAAVVLAIAVVASLRSVQQRL